jgi:hypothetical protein
LGQIGAANCIPVESVADISRIGIQQSWKPGNHPLLVQIGAADCILRKIGYLIEVGSGSKSPGSRGNTLCWCKSGPPTASR